MLCIYIRIEQKVRNICLALPLNLKTKVITEARIKKDKIYKEPLDGYAALLSDCERNAEEDSAGRRDFQDRKGCIC